MRLRKPLLALALLALLTGPAQAQTAYQTVDNLDANFSVTPGWVYYDSKGFGLQGFQQDLYYLLGASGGTEKATWNFTGLSPGQYLVSATWFADPNRTTVAPYTMSGGASPLTVTANQEAFPTDFYDAGVTWKVLAIYTITGSTLKVELTNNVPPEANEAYVIADAVRIQRVGFQGRIIDNKLDQISLLPIDDKFSYTGTQWGYYDTGLFGFQGFQNNLMYNFGPSATAGENAIWTFSGLQAGKKYRVWATWFPDPNRAKNATYTITGGAAPLPKVVNQELAPSGLVDASINWTELTTAAGYQLTTGTTLIVTLPANGADEYVIADAIRLEQVDGDPPPTDNNVARLLHQATWGPNDSLLAQVKTKGLAPFVDEQLGFATILPYSTLPFRPVNPGTGAGQGCAGLAGNDLNICYRNHYSMYPLQRDFFSRALYMPDQLRQRVAFALHQLVVVSGILPNWQPSWQSKYLQICDKHALGNYGDLLAEMTLNPAMGDWLDMVKSKKQAGAVKPNENYARELLQLFSIGLYLLNDNGTYQLDGGGNKIPTYDQLKIEEFARALTGFDYEANLPPGAAGETVINYRDPMRVFPVNGSEHDFAAPRPFLLNYPGVKLAGGQLPVRAQSGPNVVADLNDTLTNVYEHPNVGPYVCIHLIRELVTSNPSSAYVKRVVDVFNGNRASKTQLREVVRAILLDDEARGDFQSGPNYGRVQSPVLFMLNFVRAYDPLSQDRTTQSDGVLAPIGAFLGMWVINPPSVFSYYDPEFQIDNLAGGFAKAGELSILSTETALARANFVDAWIKPNVNSTSPLHTYVYGGPGQAQNTNKDALDTGQPGGGANQLNRTQPLVMGYKPLGTSISIAVLQSKAASVPQLVDYLNLMHMGGAMSTEMRDIIILGVEGAFPVANPPTAQQALRRARYALYLVTTSGQGNVQR